MTPERKAIELDHKLTSLEDEFRYWRDQAAAGGPLQLHHTQVEAVVDELAVPVTDLRGRLMGPDRDAVLRAPGGFEDAIMDVHRIWDVFRSKLALRYVEHFVAFLVGGDELAYQCYRSAERHGAGREPPLLYFGDEPSPLTHPRGALLSDAAQNDDPVPEALLTLPMPLIGLPWFQITHLPDAPSIAHEVGHDVDVDLGLARPVADLVERALVRAGVDETRRRGWRAWRSEVFADVFATLALGPAFTTTLVAFLADQRAVVSSEYQCDPVWAAHPTRTLRVLLSAATLEQMGPFATEAAALRGAWVARYGHHAMEAFVPEVDAVARAILTGPYEVLGCRRLNALIDFPADASTRAHDEAERVLRGTDPDTGDARELIAAARIAFDDDPEGYRRADVTRRILRQIRERQTVGVRASPSTPVPESERSARAAERGRRLADRIARAHLDTPSD